MGARVCSKKCRLTSYVTAEKKRQAYIRLTPGPQSSQQFKRTGCSHSQSTWMLVKVQARTYIVEKKIFLEESEFSPGL